jgi:HK97 family phage portal protein
MSRPASLGAWAADIVRAVGRFPVERKTIVPLGQGGGDLAAFNGAAAGFGVSREDGNNFRTNQVTVAEFSDRYAMGTAAALTLSAVWACVNLLSGTIASLPLMVYRRDGEKRAVAYAHPLYRMLHDSPNADQTSLDFWDFVAATIELRGNGYAEIFRAADGRPSGLGVPIPPELVEVKRLSSGSLEYRVRQDGESRTIPQSGMLHIRGFGGNPLGGLSTLSFARRTFASAMTTEAAAKETFRNGIRTNGAFVSEHPLTKEQMTEVDEVLSEKYAGAMNAGRPLILNAGMKFQAISMNPEDAQMLESRAYGIEEICRFFGVPPFMIGHTQKSTSWGTGLEQQTLGFQKFTLRRRLKRIEMALEKQLLTPADIALGVQIEFNLDGLLRGDSASRSASYASGLQNGYYTINEVRAWENLPPVEGGDLVRVQVQNAPIDGSEPPAPAAPGTPPPFADSEESDDDPTP